MVNHSLIWFVLWKQTLSQVFTYMGCESPGRRCWPSRRRSLSEETLGVVRSNDSMCGQAPLNPWPHREYSNSCSSSWTFSTCWPSHLPCWPVPLTRWPAAFLPWPALLTPLAQIPIPLTLCFHFKVKRTPAASGCYSFADSTNIPQLQDYCTTCCKKYFKHFYLCIFFSQTNKT